jgi:polyisoprenoid-binding protein YceI
MSDMSTITAGTLGEPRIGFAARTTIRRLDFHVGERSAEGTKVVVGDSVAVELDVEAHLEEADPSEATS